MDKRRSKFRTLVMGSGYRNTLTDDVSDYNQALLDEVFENLGNIYDIEEENIRGSGIYTPIRASVSEARTIKSEKVVDNVKLLTFQDLKHDLWVGKRFRFADNIWITINVNKDATISNSAQVQRCNNVLKWYDFDEEVIYEEPCVLSEKIAATRVDDQTHIQVLDGTLNAMLQYNEISKKISTNQKFIINGSAYVIKEVSAIKRLATFDKNSIGNIEVELKKTEINTDTDDLENNIAYKIPQPITPEILNGNIITPNIDELFVIQYNKQDYEVFNYIDGVIQSDTFEFEFYDAPSSKYKVTNITGNSFTIECLDFSQVPLVVSYRNTTTNEVNEFTIKLSGVL